MQKQVKIYKKNLTWALIALIPYLFLAGFLFFQCIKYTHRIFIPYIVLNEQEITVRNLLTTKAVIWKDVSEIKHETKIIEKRTGKGSGTRKKKHINFVVYRSKDATNPTLSINLLSLKIDDAEFMAFVKKYYPASRIIEKNLPLK